MSYIYTDLIRQNYRAQTAWRHVVAISQFHRIQASPGLRQAAQYVADQLSSAGLSVSIHHYPADSHTRFWADPSFLEWNCRAATLHLLDDQDNPAELLCDFASAPISLIQRSIPVSGDFEVVALGGKGGKDPADYLDLDVKGKLVLTNEPVSRVLEEAVHQRGAAGIIFDGMRLGGRSELDLPDALQYTSFWWPGQCQPDSFGFVLSPRQGQKLRTRLADGKKVAVRARVDSEFYEGAIEVVDALIPGVAGEAEVLLLAHLCHPQPSAHDNGSGVGALIEAAVTLTRLIADGQLPKPRRGLRFLWPPEFAGTYPWLAEREADVKRGRWAAGLNLDMVGADQNQTGSVWQFVGLPKAGAAFADHLLSWLREPFLSGQRYEETPFSGGSDHFILSDPTVGIPSPSFTQWPDKFYHSSADTPDKVSPDSLARSGALAAVYAYWLASAGPDETRWLGHWMITRFAAQAGQRAAAAIEGLGAAPTMESRKKAWTNYQCQSVFHAECMTSALHTLLRLALDLSEQMAVWVADAAGIAAREDTWVRATLGAETLTEEAPVDEPWRAEARSLIPRRLVPGPIELGKVFQAHSEELQAALWQIEGDAEHEAHDKATLAQYWADGQRTIADITDRVSLETGRPPDDMVLRLFKLMAETGLVELKTVG